MASSKIKQTSSPLAFEAVIKRASQTFATLKAAASQSVDLLRILNSSGTKKVYVDSNLILQTNGLVNNSGLVDLSAGTVTLPSTTVLPEYLLKYAAVTLTNTNMLALRATPIQIVAAPGAGKIIQILGGIIIFNYTAAYTETAANLALKYVNGSGGPAAQVVEATGFVDNTADTIINIFPNAINTLVTAAGELSNAAVVLHNNGAGEYGAGNAANTMIVQVAYRIHTTSL